jgi:hypothetical protein
VFDADFEPKIKKENFIDETILGALEEYPFPHSARLPKEYSFQWVGFDIIWSILYGFESEKCDRFPTRSH